MKGIVNVPAWVKEAFKNGTTYLEIGKLGLNSLDLRSDGETVDDPETWPEGWIEPIEEEIEWERVRVDAPILIENQNGFNCKVDPIRANFYEFKKGTIEIEGGVSDSIGYFTEGKNRHTADGYSYARIEDCTFPKGVNPEDWYK